MALVTINGHSNIPAIIPMAKLSEYLPEGRLAGLRMRGSKTPKGKSLPFIPRFADARATLLDLRPETNKGCTEFFFNTPPVTKVEAPKENDHNNKEPASPAYISARSETQVFQNSSNSKQNTSRRSSTTKDTPPLGPIVGIKKNNNNNSISNNTAPDAEAEDHFSPPSGRGGLNRSPNNNSNLNPDGTTAPNPSFAVGQGGNTNVHQQFTTQNSDGSIAELNTSTSAKSNAEELNVNPRDLLSDLFVRRGKRDNNNTNKAPIRRLTDDGKKKQEQPPAPTNNDKNALDSDPFNDFSYLHGTGGNVADQKKSSSRQSSPPPKRQQSRDRDDSDSDKDTSNDDNDSDKKRFKKSIDEGIQKTKDFARATATSAMAAADEFLTRISPQREKSTERSRSSKNSSNNNNIQPPRKLDQQEQQEGLSRRSSTGVTSSASSQRIENLIRQGREFYDSTIGKGRGNKEEKNPIARQFGEGDNNDDNENVANNNNKKTSNNNNNDDYSPATSDQYAGANIINAAKAEFKKNSKFFKERLGRLMESAAAEEEAKKIQSRDESTTEEIAPAPQANQNNNSYSNPAAGNDHLNSTNSAVFPGGRFTRLGEPTADNNNNNNLFGTAIPSQEEKAAAARRARILTGFRGLVRNEDAMVTGLPEGTKVEPRYTKRNDFHTYVNKERRATGTYQSPASNSMRKNDYRDNSDDNDDGDSIDIITSSSPQQRRQQSQESGNKSTIPAGMRSIDPYSQQQSTHEPINDDDAEELEEVIVKSNDTKSPSPPAVSSSSSPGTKKAGDATAQASPNPLHDHVGDERRSSSTHHHASRKNEYLHEIAPDPHHHHHTNPETNPLAANVPRKQARISSASPEQHPDNSNRKQNGKSSSANDNSAAAAAPAAKKKSDNDKKHSRNQSNVTDGGESTTSSSSTEYSDELPDNGGQHPQAANQPERKSLNKKWVSDRADALRVLLFGLALLIGICIAALERDSWMTCNIRTVTRAVRGVVITDAPPIITDANALVGTVGTHVYVAARTGLWQSCVTIRINTSEEGRLLFRFEDNLRNALRTVRDGPQRSEDSAVLSRNANPGWHLGDGLSILSSVGFTDALPVYQLCTEKLRDHSECNAALGITFSRMATLAVLVIVFSGLFFIGIVLDLTVVKWLKVKIHKVVLGFLLIFIWAMSLAVWVLYVDSSNVPANAASTHAECELEANLREALASIAYTTLNVATNSSRYEALLEYRDSQNRTFFNATENATLEAMRDNLTVVPPESLSNRVMYFDDCQVGFSTWGWLGAWMAWTVIVSLYLLARFSAYQAYNREKTNSNPFNPANLIRFGLHSMMPGVFGLPSSSGEGGGAASSDGWAESGSDYDDSYYYSDENEEDYASEDDKNGNNNDNIEGASYNNNNEPDYPEDDDQANDEIVALRNEAERNIRPSALPASVMNNNNNNNEPESAMGIRATSSATFNGTSPTTPSRAKNRGGNINDPHSRPGHRKGRGSRGSNERLGERDREGWLSQTFSQAVGAVGEFLNKSFAGPSPDNLERRESFQQTNRNRGHRHRSSANSGGGYNKDEISSKSILKSSNTLRVDREESDPLDNTTRSNRGAERGNVGPPPDHHRRRSSGQSSNGSKSGEKGFFATIAGIAVDKIVPFIVGMPANLQKHEAARLVKGLYPNLPTALVNKMVDFVVDAARVLAKEAQENARAEAAAEENGHHYVG